MPKKKSIWKRIYQNHLYAWHTKLYWTIFKNIFRLIIVILLLAVIYYILDHYVIDVEDVFNSFIVKFSNWKIFTIFFASESFLGLLPPDLFIVWIGKLQYPWLYLSVLAILSYVGGVLSYQIGMLFSKNKGINNYIERRFKENIKNIKRWGAAFIIIAALLPLPYSIVCIISGLLKYPFFRFLLIGTTRILRFFLYALMLFKII